MSEEDSVRKTQAAIIGCHGGGRDSKLRTAGALQGLGKASDSLWTDVQKCEVINLCCF